jgi:hypothetical protein
MVSQVVKQVRRLDLHVGDLGGGGGSDGGGSGEDGSGGGELHLD